MRKTRLQMSKTKWPIIALLLTMAAVLPPPSVSATPKQTAKIIVSNYSLNHNNLRVVRDYGPGFPTEVTNSVGSWRIWNIRCWRRSGKAFGCFLDNRRHYRRECVDTVSQGYCDDYYRTCKAFVKVRRVTKRKVVVVGSKVYEERRAAYDGALKRMFSCRNEVDRWL